MRQAVASGAGSARCLCGPPRKQLVARRLSTVASACAVAPQRPVPTRFSSRTARFRVAFPVCNSATPGAGTSPGPEGDFETADGTGSVDGVKSALREAGVEDETESSGSKKSGLAGFLVRLMAVCGITTVLWAVFASSNGMLRIAAGILGGSGFGAYGFRKKSLDTSGAIAAALVGCCTLISSFRCTVVLLAFFFASSAITRIGEHMKDIDDEHKAGGQRDWKQVLCNGGPPSVIAAVLGWLASGTDLPLGLAGAPASVTALASAFMGYYACCCGDTWASELGVLSKTPPRLITTLKTVRPGTNGGVSLLGLAASLGGGLFVGFCFALAGILAPGNPAHQAIFQQQAILAMAIGGAAGLFGSLVDSLLGATIQFTGYNNKTNKITSKRGPDVTHISGISILDNNAVNLVSATVTSAATAMLASAVFL